MNRKVDIFEMEGQYFAFPDGMGSVLKFDSMIWVNIGHSNHHGYNYISKKFRYNQKIHSFGGYGFWRSNGMVTAFNPTIGNWEVIQSKNGQSCSSIYSFISKEILYVLSPDCIDDSNQPSKTENSIYTFNLNSNEWNKLGYHNIKMNNNVTIETDHYFYIHNHPKILIHKQNLEFKSKSVSYLEPINASSDSSVFIVWKDSIIYKTSNEIDLILDLNQEYNNLGKKEKLVQSNFTKYFLFISCLLALITIAMVWIRNRPKSIPNNDPLIVELLKFDGVTLSQEKLDEILNIDQIKDPNLKKAKDQT